jgi:hypothetical protein
MKILRIIDKQTNIFIRDDFTFDESTEIGLDVQPSQGLYIPKWSGTEWIEGATQEYIDKLKAQAIPTEPTLEEKVLEHDVKIVTLEETIDVIYGSGA